MGSPGAKGAWEILNSTKIWLKSKDTFGSFWLKSKVKTIKIWLKSKVKLMQKWTKSKVTDFRPENIDFYYR